MTRPTMRDYLATPTLTDLERDILTRRFVLDDKVSQIAHDLNVTERNVHARLANARRKIASYHHATEEHA